MAQGGDDKDLRGVTANHTRFQHLVASIFLGSAAVVGLWILFGPDTGRGLTAASVLLFVELPLFVILALVGMNALVRAGMGPKRKR